MQLTRSKLKTITSVILMIAISLITFELLILSVYSLFFSNINGRVGGARNGLEIFSLLLFAFPIFVFYSSFGAFFYGFNYGIITKSSYYPNRARNLIYSWVIYFLYNCILLFIYNHFLDNSIIALMCGLVYAMVVTIPYLWDAYLVTKNLFLKNN